MTGAQMKDMKKEVIGDLLFQLADDDFLIAFRGSEWLGLAPHIEADVAFSSISQDCMGHASMYYRLLEDLGFGKADDQAHLRPAEERRNSIVTERTNGEGDYIETPKYDWAYAVVRNFFYTAAKKIKIDSLRKSSYKPLADAATKINMELYYHLLHWKTWFVQLIDSTDDARNRMENAVKLVEKDFGDMFRFGTYAKEIHKQKLIEEGSLLQEKWQGEMVKVYTSIGMDPPKISLKVERDGRLGEHTKDLETALETLSAVYRMDTAASW
ncbi:ring-1,2-phenylacetyl-CoA epoxidase subunit PaaC [Bacillus thermophilus]|uniref:Ring-1,2-phenylacetyl-CoA epoxidase subunit PaaC n=2 Tax=Bacillaceae TaxID=186817 RepID=A0ABS2R9T0_9BACI|nr:ring-1,2-phenylacetyl-CoA epoxidase subunit PaaC [Siminovitchia thermophila]